MIRKITCATCSNEKDKRCIVKKVSVAINKKRHCDNYVLEPTKVKTKQVLKTIKMSYAERESMRKEYKSQLKQLKRAMKQNLPTQNISHPLTGDLSRFTSTAGSDRRGG